MRESRVATVGVAVLRLDVLFGNFHLRFVKDRAEVMCQGIDLGVAVRECEGLSWGKRGHW